MKRKTLPLGIDLGRSRVRVSLVELDGDGRPHLVAVAAREAAGADRAAALASAVAELQTAERRCVLGLDEPSGLVRLATFPKMTRAERERAARFEAARFIDYAAADAVVRIEPVDGKPATFALGIAKKRAVSELTNAAREARLRPIAIDGYAFALARALPNDDAVIDVGTEATVMHVFGRDIPSTRVFAGGGASITAAIAQSLGIDLDAAERRKRMHGLAGAGAYVHERLVEDIASAVVDARAAGGDVRQVALVGNGARLSDFAAALERATALRVRLAAFSPDVSPTLPPDVLRAAAPDWSVAYGLALWDAAR